MSSVKIVLDTRTKKKDGTSPLKLRVMNRSRSFYVSLGISVFPEQFDNTGGRTLMGWVINHPRKGVLNQFISHKYISASDELVRLSDYGLLRHIDMADLKKEITRVLFGEEKVSDPEPEQKLILFRDVFSSFMQLKTGRTLEIYQATETKLRKLFDYDNLLLDDITKTWLTKLQNTLHETNSTNASAIHLRNIRAVINYAIDEELTEKYPFRKFTIKTERTVKRSLSFAQFKMLRDYPCEDMQNEYRDMFLLIFYLIGINITDLINAKTSDIVDGRLTYHRSKTHKLYSIKLEPEAIELIEKYKGKSHLVCPLDRYKSVCQYTRRMNCGLQSIGPYTRSGLGGKKDIEPIIPGLTTYWARHTWATYAHKIGISKDIISMSLGHSFGSKVTDTYIDYDSEKVDEANRRVIDFVKSL